MYAITRSENYFSNSQRKMYEQGKKERKLQYRAVCIKILVRRHKGSGARGKMRLIRMKIKCDNFFLFLRQCFSWNGQFVGAIWVWGWGASGYGGSREFQLRNDKVSGQQQSLSHKKSFLWGVNETTSALSLPFSWYFRFLCVRNFPQASCLIASNKGKFSKTTQWGSLYIAPFRGNEICLQIWFACHAQHN